MAESETTQKVTLVLSKKHRFAPNNRSMIFGPDTLTQR
ncbi:hypothetical protein GQ55_7G224400 [Panicum hallii var. hallii]|uniref:Uncharacterized protein n=1 Tax=Panicum hallii var. hallii TaxID=1504633 RepID=A0A2T7CXV1_9POAL|nr:hypothetical protein GQ55_7G224400 [Panicum hallii var. hallii]